MQYKGYTGMYGFEDGVYHGRVAGLTRDVVTVESEKEDEVEHEFQVSVDCYLEWCTERGEQPEMPTRLS
jgi:predicted HicB family RNase H-like nuclease